VGYTSADPAAVRESEPQSGRSAELRWRHGLAQRPRGRRNSIRYLFSLSSPANGALATEMTTPSGGRLMTARPTFRLKGNGHVND